MSTKSPKKTEKGFAFEVKRRMEAKGFTLIEALISFSIVLLLATALIILFRPVETLKRGRDHKRLSDLSLLDRAISEYKVDKGTYPDANNTLRDSTVLPAGSTSLTNAQSGWIKDNLKTYSSRMPIDPLNDTTYKYQYIHNGDTYELNAKLEYYTDEARNDGGNDSSTYEIGNALTLISP